MLGSLVKRIKISVKSNADILLNLEIRNYSKCLAGKADHLILTQLPIVIASC